MHRKYLFKHTFNMKNQFTTSADLFNKASETTYLFKKQWKENTVALFRSPRENDKLPFITDLLRTVAVNGRKVLYVNTERRAEIFVEQFIRNENLLIFTPSYETPDDKRDYADLVIDGIVEAIAETDIRVFVIDSITRIAAMSFGRNASPAYLMKRLAALQARHGVSLLVIAHTATKSTDRAISALADCELAELSESTELSEFSECYEPSEFSDFSASHLSRRKRRELERRERKLAVRHRS